jgi:multiple sugar transport system substrate-binding protein
MTRKRKALHSPGPRSGQRISRRDFLRSAALGIAGSTLVGSGLNRFAIPSIAQPKPQISVLMLTAPAMLARRDLIPEFEKKFGIQVQWEDTAYEDIHTKEITDFTAHTGRYDVVQMDNPWLVEYAGAGYIENLEPHIKSAGFRLTKDESRRWPPGVNAFPTIHLEDMIVPLLNFYGNWGGNLYALADMPGVQLLYLRKDLFEDPQEQANFKKKYGYALAAPKTWKELRDMAEFFTRPPSLYGVTWSAGKGNMAVQNYYNVGWSWGADCFAFGQGFPDKTDPIHNMPILNSPLGIKALEFFIGLKPFMPPGVAAYEWAEITQDYIGGKAAMMFQWSDFIRDVEDPAKSTVAGKVLYAKFPGDPSAPRNNVPGITPGQGYASLGGWAIVMNKDSKNKEAAWKFMAWATGLAMNREELAHYLDVGGTNSGRELGYKLPGTKGYKVGRYQVELDMYLNHVRRRPAIAEELEYETIVGGEAQRAFVGEKSAKQALDDAARALYELAVRGGYIPRGQPLVWPTKYVNPDGTKRV